MITIRNLSKSYGSKEVLRGIDLAFAKGRVYGIVGKNGAGKTTLFRCIAGLESHRGTIESEYEPLRNHLGLLETNPVFMSRITGWEYLKLFCLARNIRADDFADRNIFDLPLDEYAEAYSTGMQKKLALLAILLRQNEVFILDEPFNGVDIQSNILIVDLIKRLKQRNKTILIASHVFSTLRDTCDEIYLLDNGRIERRVTEERFADLEAELSSQIIGDRIERLEL